MIKAQQKVKMDTNFNKINAYRFLPILIAAGISISKEETWLYRYKFEEALKQGDKNVVTFFVNEGIDVNMKFLFDETPLILASRTEQPEIAEFLIEKGANLESCNKYTGYTALMTAVLCKYERTVKLLIEKGANLYPSIIEKALITGNESITAFLINTYKESVRDLEYIFFSSAFRGHKNIVKAFINKSIDIDARTKWGRSALIAASQNNHVSIIELLIESGADIEAYDDEGETSLMTASRYMSFESVKLLVEKGANVHAVDNKGWTALIYAARNNRKRTVELLLNNGGADTSMNNALRIASKYGYDEVAGLLIQAGAL